MRIQRYLYLMPRLNIYLPQEVYDIARRWRDSANLSEICARAIREELDAADAHRAAIASFEAFRAPSQLERAVGDKYGLRTVIIESATIAQPDVRDRLGKLAASYLDRMICDGSSIAVAGGRQMWCVVQNASPRHVRTSISALGLHHADPKLLHVHPNTLTTLLWLLYSPRSVAHVIGSGADAPSWNLNKEQADYPTYFVVSSCGVFSPASPFASLVGASVTNELVQHEVIGDFGYVFLTGNGDIVPVQIDCPHFVLPAPVLRDLSKRRDARIVLVAGGSGKSEIIRVVLTARLCNTLITDSETASRLL